MFWNVFRPGNFSQKWIFYDEKTEKLFFFLSIFNCNFYSHWLTDIIANVSSIANPERQWLGELLTKSAAGAPNAAGKVFTLHEFRKLLTKGWTPDCGICLAEFLVERFCAITILLGALLGSVLNSIDNTTQQRPVRPLSRRWAGRDWGLPQEPRREWPAQTYRPGDLLSTQEPQRSLSNACSGGLWLGFDLSLCGRPCANFYHMGQGWQPKVYQG